MPWRPPAAAGLTRPLGLTLEPSFRRRGGSSKLTELVMTFKHACPAPCSCVRCIAMWHKLTSKEDTAPSEVSARRQPSRAVVASRKLTCSQPSPRCWCLTGAGDRVSGMGLPAGYVTCTACSQNSAPSCMQDMEGDTPAS